MQVYQLDPYYLPLYGQRLIEASAGTGKTYTIVIFYLRLLLGIRQKNVISRRLSVKEILVVTFTEMATNELRLRIRDSIHQMRIACIRNGIGFDKNSRFCILLSFISNKDQAAQWLLTAERQMDEAAIYTIHGFCHYILVHNAFMLGMSLRQSIIKNEYPLQQQACADFWRSNYYSLNYSMSKVIVNEWSDPDSLLTEIRPYLYGDIPSFINQTVEVQSIEERHELLINIIKSVKKLWIIDSDKLINLIVNSSINKHIYNHVNLSIWLGIVTSWAKSETVDYTIPREINRFSQSEITSKTLIGKAVEHEIFSAIDNLLQQSFTLRDLIISKSIISIRQIISQEKERRMEIGFDDLLSNLNLALQGNSGEKLSCKIRNNYPVAMIDEFQDTDPQQYRIFQSIYQEYSNCGLLFIGDPKQSIYAFRGADIFTYFTAKDKIKSYYTININWRSSPNMIAAINQLFTLVEKPFLFEQISFDAVKPANLNKNLTFIHNKKKLLALNFNYLDKETVSVLDYQQIMAKQCASQIYEWLKGGENRTSWLYKNNVKHPVTAADVIVLVRTSYEAIIIQEALSKFNISSIFLSNKENIFATNEARDLLWILQAVISPYDENALRCALATKLIGLNAQDIEELNQNENQWGMLIKEFANYLLIWHKNGILSTLRAIIFNKKIIKDILSDDIEGEYRLINVIRLGEILQEIELQFSNHHALVRWLARQIDEPNSVLESQQISLESDNRLIKISTIHKSKGLEFPIVCLPFACQFFQQKLITFHDRKNFRTCMDLTRKEESVNLANEEYLAEDLRLLYVALTRAKYHCSIGIAPLINGYSKKVKVNTDLHQTALGYLLQKGKSGNASLLRNTLNMLASENIGITPVSDINLLSLCPNKNKQINLMAKEFTGKIKNNWRITSYSELTSHDTECLLDKYIDDSIDIEITIQNLMPKISDNGQNNIFLTQNETVHINKNIHNFPNGALAGVFLHFLLESLPFSQHPSESWLAEKLKQFGFSEDWAPILKIWLINIFSIPLIKNSFSLINIIPKYQLNEMQFYLPIKRLLLSSDLNNLICQYDSLSKDSIPLSFKPLRGILKGYIDLVFYWQNKFYLLDYKSNWLGEDNLAYNQEAICNSMINHRYDLQYQFYTLALHRYLQNRLFDYDYRKDFGGVIYLFLRGVDINNPSNAIYHTIPSYELINGLDKLFNMNDLGENDDKFTKESC